MKTIGAVVYRLDSVDSTNDEMSRRLSMDPRVGEGMVIVADHQRKGKGLGSNRWESEPGLNLTFSFAVMPGFLEAHRQFFLNMAVSLGIWHAVGALLPGRPVRIKWPNDIYVGTGKVAGILIQNSITGNRIDHSVVGIGLNVNQVVFPPAIPNAVSLRSASGGPFVREEVLARLLEELNIQYRRIRSGDFGGCFDEYSAVLYGQGEWRPYRHGGREIRGRLSGITEMGQLVLERAGGDRIECDMKEIEYLY